MAKTFLDDYGFLHKQRPKNKNLTFLERELIPPVYFTDEELYASKGTVLLFDLEIYPNYFLAAFKQYNGNKVVTFELYPGTEVFNAQKLLWVMHNFCLVGFNSNKFDIPILYMALQGCSLDDLHEAVEMIIQRGAQPRDIEERFKFKIGQINTVDLIEVAPLSASLKAYMARLHAQRLQDLPYDPNKPLSVEEAYKVLIYCCNDLDGTGLLLKELEPQLELRASMSLEYKQDLRSKSDAQIAEAVICSEVAKLIGRYPKRPKIEPGTTFKYNVPDFITYQTKEFQDMLEVVKNTVFTVEANGKISTSSNLEEYKVKLGKSVYRMGVGGLHSSEECIAHYADEDTLLLDVDASSYYPSIILNQSLYPKHMGLNFLEVYRSIVTRRLKAKKEGNKVVADSLKITINGSFGKLNSKYSSLYAPDLLIQVTLSGQLCLLFLIEMIELSGIPVVSANTDGIVIKCKISRYDNLVNIIKLWENITGFETEETRYKSIFLANVNNYVTVKTDGKTKLKGAYAKAGLSKNPVSTICIDAVIEKITNDIPIEKTIKECKDITKFVIARNVKGGAEKDGVYLGKIVRWYYAYKQTGTINYVMTGNKVPKSEGGYPVMDLPPSFPDNIDYNRYIEEATEILIDIGYLKASVQESFF